MTFRFTLKSEIEEVTAMPPELTLSAAALPRRKVASYALGLCPGYGLWPINSKDQARARA
jgi:hypothetical protein